MASLESTLSGMRPGPQDMEWQRRLAGEFANHLQVPGTCKDCGGEVTFVSRTEDMVAYPGMETLVNIIVCNDCADFRAALRDYGNRLKSIVTMYRRMTESLMNKENELRASGKISSIAPLVEKQAELDTDVRASVRGVMSSVVRAFATKTGKQHPGTAEVEHWAEMAMNIKMAGNIGSRYEAAGKFITDRDTTWEAMKQVQNHFGVNIRNHWKQPNAPQYSDKVSAGVPAGIIPKPAQRREATASLAAVFDDCPL